MPETAPIPKVGLWLVCSEERKRVAVEQVLSSYNVKILGFWDRERAAKKGEVPGECQYVLLVRDGFNGNFGVVRHAVGKSSARLIYTTFHTAGLVTTLENLGLKRLPDTQPVRAPRLVVVPSAPLRPSPPSISVEELDLPAPMAPTPSGFTSLGELAVILDTPLPQLYNKAKRLGLVEDESLLFHEVEIPDEKLLLLDERQVKKDYHPLQPKAMQRLDVIPPELPVGSVRMADMARKLGVSPKTVEGRMKSLGISGHSNGLKPPWRRVWVTPEEQKQIVSYVPRPVGAASPNYKKGNLMQPRSNQSKPSRPPKGGTGATTPASSRPPTSPTVKDLVMSLQSSIDALLSHPDVEGVSLENGQLRVKTRKRPVVNKVQVTIE